MANLHGTLKAILERNLKQVKSAAEFMERRANYIVNTRLANTTENLTYDKKEVESIDRITDEVYYLYNPPLEDEEFQTFWEQYFLYNVKEAEMDFTNRENMKKLMGDIFSWIQLRPWLNNISAEDVIEGDQ